MERYFLALLTFLALTTMSFSATANQPNQQMTPGIACSPADPNFMGFDYPEHIAVCNRNVSQAEKLAVSNAYGVPMANWRFYEFDHLIPLCAGGSDDPRNIWPEVLNHAHLKDQLEDQVCAAMRAGTMTQNQAIQEIFSWLNQHPFETTDAVDTDPSKPQD